MPCFRRRFEAVLSAATGSAYRPDQGGATARKGRGQGVTQATIRSVPSGRPRPSKLLVYLAPSRLAR